MKILLLDRLEQRHKYFMREQFITIEDFRSTMRIYEVYKKNGGNGAADEIMSDLKDLSRT